MPSDYTCLIQALQQLLTDHQPELVSLRKESQHLFVGPESEPTYLSQLNEAFPGDTNSASGVARPGQRELEETLSDYEARFEALKQRLQSSSSQLSSQLEQAKKLKECLETLLSWVAEAEGQLDNLSVCELSSSVVNTQLQNCQVS